LAAVATSTLRPLTVGEILDAAVVVVTRHWKPLLGSLLLVSTPIWAIFILLIASIDASVFELDSSSTTTEDPTGNVIAGLGVITLLLMVVFLVSFIAVFKGVCDAWVGAEPRMGKSLGFGVRRAGWVLLLSLIWLPSITAFSLFCGIPAFWLGTVWCLSIPAMLFERLGPFRALGRSFSLIRGRFWEALVVVLVITAAYYVLSYVVSIPILGVAVLAGGDNGVTNAIAYGVAGLIGSVVTVPYIASLLTIVWAVPMTVFIFACGIPAFWLGTVWCLSIPAMLFERLGPFRALGRSFSLIRGRFWEALVVVLVILAVYYVLSYVVSIPILAVAVLAGGDNGVTNAIAYGVAGLLGSVVTVPYIAALLTILYFDQRVRKEGFDIQLLAADGLSDPLPGPLVAPAGFAVPSPPPPQWQSAGGWTRPAPAGDAPLRWGPAAEPPPAAASAWTPPGSDEPPSPWMTPGGSAPSSDEESEGPGER
jgi:hypothetical protein